jgi:hypothetical protein
MTMSDNNTNTHPRSERAEFSVDNQTGGKVIESLVRLGDLSALSSAERARFYVQMCEGLGLNPHAQPFAFLKLNGKEVFYATRGATDQLAAMHKLNREIVDGPKVIDLAGTKLVYAVCRATHPNGRVETATATVPLIDPVNVLMKCECVPLDSEILTRDGWKTHDQVRVGEEVLAYDTEGDQCRWTPLQEVSVFRDAPVSELRSPEGQFSVRCTPNHKWAVRKPAYRPRAIPGGRGARGAYTNRAADVQLVEAWDINTSHRLVLAAPERETEQSVLEPAEAAILGWMVTDGTLQRRGSFPRIGICQSKEENFEIIRETVATVAGGPVNEVVSAARTRTFPTGRTYDTLEQHWWYLPAEVSRSILRKAGFATRADLPKIVTRLSPKARSAMLHAMMLAEADARGRFANGDRDVMDAFEILAALQGSATGELKPHGPIWTKRLKKTSHVAGQLPLLARRGYLRRVVPDDPLWHLGHATGGTRDDHGQHEGEAPRDLVHPRPRAARRDGDRDHPRQRPGALQEGVDLSAIAAQQRAEVPPSLRRRRRTRCICPPPMRRPPSEDFYQRLAEIELPGESVAVWMKLPRRPRPPRVADREGAWKALCKRTEEVGQA